MSEKKDTSDANFLIRSIVGILVILFSYNGIKFFKWLLSILGWHFQPDDTFDLFYHYALNDCTIRWITIALSFSALIIACMRILMNSDKN